MPLVILASQEGPADESGNGDEKDPPPPLNRSANPRLKVKAKDKHDKFVHAEYDVKLEVRPSHAPATELWRYTATCRGRRSLDVATRHSPHAPQVAQSSYGSTCSSTYDITVDKL